MKMRATIFTLASFVGLAGLGVTGCEGEAPVPDRPTWAEDVLPILRGNCFNCHGADSARLSKSVRFDVYDPTDALYEGFEEGLESQAGAKTFAPALLMAAMRTDKPMPPPPATPLSEREIAVLQAWIDSNTTKGRHSPNRRPTARVVGRRVVDGTLRLTLDVRDADFDTVVGNAAIGDTVKPIHRAGRHTLDFPGESQNAGVRVELTDGWVRVGLDL
jgi:hypothetical protein